MSTQVITADDLWPGDVARLANGGGSPYRFVNYEVTPSGYLMLLFTTENGYVFPLLAEHGWSTLLERYAS